MKTQLKRLSKSTLAVVLTICMLFSCVLVGTITTVEAAPNFYDYGGTKNFHLYYDDSLANISNNGARNVYFIIGHTNYSSVYSMTRIANTTLYYYNLTNDWKGATGFCFGSKTTAPKTGSLDTSRKDCSAVTNNYTSSTSFYGNNRTYYFKASAAKAISYEEIATGSDKYSDIKNNITLSTKRKLNGASSYSDYTSSTNLVVLRINSGYWNYKAASLGTTPTTDYKNGSVTYENAVAAVQTTLSYESLNSNYTFDGFYNSSGTALSANPFYQPGQKSNVTYYGYISEKTHSVAVKQQLGSSAATDVSTKTIGNVTGINVTADATVTSGGKTYDFDHWAVSGGTITYSTSASGTYSSKAAGTTITNRNIYVKTAADNVVLTAVYTVQATTHDVNFTPSPTGGTVKVNNSSTSPQAVAENDTYTIQATPNTGYKLTALSAGGTAIAVTEAGGTYTATMGTANQTVTATFAKQSYALNYTNAANQHTFDVKVDGSSISSGTNVEYGKTVNVTVNGYDDSNGTIYIINSVTGQTLTSVSGSGTKTYSGTFTMPASAVTLTATSVPTYRVNFTGDSNMTVTVKETNSSGATVNDGDYVAENTKLYVSATAASGYELNNSIGVILSQGSATGTTIPYSGTINAVTAPVNINVSSKKITQYTVTLQNGTNVTGYKVSYTKNKATVSNADYSSPITVDAGSTVTATATVSNNTRYSVDKWSVNDTEQANSDNNTFTTAAINAATKLKADADKRSDYVYVYSTFFSQDPKDWLKINGTLLKDYTYSYDSKTMIVTVYGLTEGEQITFSQDNPSHTVTATGTITYGNLYTLSATNNVWQTQVEVAGDYDTVTTLLISKWYWDAAFENIILRDQSWVSGVYVWSNSGSTYYKPLGDGDNNECTNNLYNNGDVARVEYIDGEPYYAMTIRNSEFGEGVTTFKYKLYNGNKDDHTPDPTTALAVGYTYIIKAHKDNNTYTVDVSPEEGGNVPVVPTSDYYLDGWTHVNNSAFSKVDNSLRMMVGTLDEGSYSYYKVNTLAYSGHGDTGLSLFAVKTPEDAALATTGTNKYLYLLGSDIFGKNDCYVGYSTDGTNFTEKNMTHVANDGSNKIWKYPVPSNTTKIYFKTIVDGTTYYASNNSANYTVASGEKMAYHVYGSGTFTKVAWNADGYTDVLTQGEDLGGTAGSGHYYVWNTDNAYVTTTPNEDLFQSDGLLQNSGYDDGKSAFDLPFHTGTTASGYYVIVIHPNTNYRFTKEDGTVLTYNNTSSHPIIYTSSVLPGVEMPPTPVRAIYAKDGALRNGYQRFSEFGTTEITQILDTNGTDVTSSFASSHARKDWTDGADGNMDYDYVENIPFGYTIKWKTTLGDGKYDGTNQFKNSHYVRGFSVNGVTEELFEYSSTGVYTGTHVVNNEDCRRGHIEITPVYWLKNATYTKTFYVTGFDRTNTAYRELGWGDELGIYPYYENVNGADNAFGGYPGQPMIFYKGTYVQQIPTTVTGLAGGAQIKGMTLGNNYWDLLHRSINGSDPIYPVNHHRQTYDFDDFYEIANEQKPDSITFSYRLRTVNDNFGDGAEQRNTLAVHTDTVNLSDYENTTTHNGTEIYKDALDRQIDLFGTVLTSTQASQDPLLVITNGYKNTYVGKYATEWAVYRKDGSSYQYITSISPSALEVKSSANLSKYGAGAYTAAYTALEAYRGVPVKISFEKSMENSTGDIADRLDGRWYYTKSGDQVEANIVIQYDDGNGYVSDDFTATTGDDRNLGSHTGARAYFTNVTPNDIYGDVTSGKTTLTADTQYFNLKAEESANYQFVGWYQMQDNQYVPMEQEEGVTETHTIIKSNETYYARFKKITSGTLSVKHIIQNGTISGTNYNGTGTPYLSVQITDTNGTVVANFPKATGSSFIHSKYIRSLYANYNIKVTIQTEPDQENVFRTYALTNHSNDKFITPTSGSLTNSGDCVFEFKVADLFNNTLSEQTVTSLEYVSRLTKTEYTYEYQIDYVFPSRYWNNQTYRVTGSIAANRVSNFVEGKQTDAKLKQSVLQTLTPYESQFRKVISWGYTAGYNSQTATLVSGTNYKISTTITANFDENELVHAEFKLPYEYDKTTEHYTAIARDFYSTTPAYADKTEEEYRTIYQGDVTGEPSVTEYGTTPIAPTDTQTTTTVDGDNSGVGYYSNYSSFTLASEVGRTFNTDNSVTTDRSAMKMVTAPDYVYKVNGTDNVSYHTYRVAAYYYSYNAGEQGYHYGYKDFNDGIIANNLQKKYFTRWDIYVDGKVINSCYSKEFNYTAYQDIVVVPVYESDSPSANVTGAAGQGAVANITFLGTTRNQWNVEGLGDSQVQVKKNGAFVNVTATDRLFADFDVDLAYNNKVFRDIDGTVSGNMRFETGVVIQQLGDLSGRGTDSVDTNATTYANMYKDQYNADAMAAWINTGSGSKGDNFTTVKSVIGDNFGNDDSKRLDKNHELISNKNTVEYCYYLTKSRRLSGESEDTNYPNNYSRAYRAIAYVKYSTDGGATWNTKVSSTPAYFTIYDEAIREQ